MVPRALLTIWLILELFVFALPVAPVSAMSNAAAATPVDCATLWADGIPREGTGLTDCLEHSNERIGGSDFRVVYPAQWATATDGGWGGDRLDAAKAALRRSVDIYSKLGLMGAVTIVFARLEGASGADTRADADLVSALSDEPCSVFVFPAADADTDSGFRQVIAHELFHCFQAFNFDVKNEYLAHPASAWWVEGSATYFSNVVYPDTNLEFEHIPEFDGRSPTTAVTQLSYAACFFFQYLGNAIGNKSLIGLLDALPVGGDEGSHQAALRAWPAMDALFQQFAQQYMDVAIMDSSGVPVPFTPNRDDKTVFDRSGTLESKIPPFVIRRREVLFDESLTFTLSITATDGPSLRAFAPTPGAWIEVPPTIDCGDPRTWLAVLTSIGKAGASVSAPAVVTVTTNATEADCEKNTDTCLHGTWGVDDYETFLQAALDQAGATSSAVPVTFEGSSGDLALHFDAETITYTAGSFELYGSATTQGTVVEVTVRLDGVATAGYEVIEEGTIELIELNAEGFSVEAEVSVGGSSAGSTPMDPEEWIFFISPTYGYTCSESVLELTIPPLAEPVVFTRIE